jgi:hypothetical protein
MVVALALAGLAAGLAWATIPGPDGLITACYLKSGGTLRVIDPSVTKCKSSETRLTWNVAGQQGLQGPEGPAGPAGPGVAYADRIEDDCPTCGPGVPVSTDWEGEELLTLTFPDTWDEGPRLVAVTASLDVVNESDYPVQLNCAAAHENFVWTVAADSRESTSFTQGNELEGGVQLSCGTHFATGGIPDGVTPTVYAKRVTLTAMLAEP